MATRQREKAARIAKERDKRPTAVAKNIRISSDKVGIVLDLIRGKSYEQALGILNNTNKSASDPILKVLNSAAANAENNLNMAKDTLYVAQTWAMPGPTMKRMMPRARGRADRILKRTSHIRIILDEKQVDAKMEVKKAVTKTAKPKAQPKIDQERPLTKEPNAKKPLGEKKVAPKGGKA
jgi:large subunit ribosomal protein L22